MKKITLNLMLCAALFSVASCNDTPDDAKEVANEQNEAKFEDTNIEKDTEFAVAAADDGMFEVEAGRLALNNASSTNAKEVAQMMIDEHSKANEELKSAAAAKNITLPTSISESKQNKLNDLSKKTGADFDKAYLSEMEDAHKSAIDKFEKQANDGNDADLKAWAGGKVPVLKHHLEMVQSAQEALKK
jgi:putative membrane protein